MTREREEKRKRRRRNGNSFLCLRRATTTNDNSLKIHFYFILLDYLSPCLVTTVSGTDFFSHTYTNITLMHEYHRVALEKLDLYRLLDIFYVNIHDGFMDCCNYK
jgi:hypothetical protein